MHAPRIPTPARVNEQPDHSRDDRSPGRAVRERGQQIHQLQRTAGNRAVVQRFARRGGEPHPGVAAPGARTPLPGALRARMERSFEADFSDVRLAPESHEAAQLGAQAMTRGSRIDLAPGMYRPGTRAGDQLLGHELAHVVQQRQGRVTATRQAKGGVELNDDAGLEREADDAGARAARGEPAGLGAAPPPTGGAGPAQCKLGFEYELIVFVDSKGHRIPEKTRLGTYGNHLLLDVDESMVGDAEEPAPAGWNSIWDDTDSSYKFVDTTGTTTQDTRPVGAAARYPSIVEIVTKAYAPETKDGATKILEAVTEAQTLALALKAQTITGGNKRVPADQIAGVAAAVGDLNFGSSDVHCKMDIEASIQTTLGVDIAQLGSLFETLAKGTKFKLKHHADIEGVIGEGTTEMRSGSNGDVVARELVLCSANAKKAVDDTLTEVAVGQAPDWKATWQPHVRRLEGLMTLMAQYLRLGRYMGVYDRDVTTGQVVNDSTGHPKVRWSLDKNVVSLMSRTDLAKIFKQLTTGDERLLVAWGLVKSKLATHLLTETGRNGARALFNVEDDSLAPNGAAPNAGLDISCSTFIDNVFTRDTDGVTARFGAIQEFGPETVSPWTKHHDDESGNDYYYNSVTEQSQWEQPTDFDKKGLVVELRNMIPKGLTGRFPPGEWSSLAQYVTWVTRKLNMRDPSVQGAVSGIIKL